MKKKLITYVGIASVALLAVNGAIDLAKDTYNRLQPKHQETYQLSVTFPKYDESVRIGIRRHSDARSLFSTTIKDKNCKKGTPWSENTWQDAELTDILNGKVDVLVNPGDVYHGDKSKH